MRECRLCEHYRPQERNPRLGWCELEERAVVPGLMKHFSCDSLAERSMPQ